jgi:hypothetical protein
VQIKSRCRGADADEQVKRYRGAGEDNGVKRCRCRCRCRCREAEMLRCTGAKIQRW